MDLDHHAFFASIPIANLCNTITRTANFQEDLSLDCVLCGCNHELRLFEVARGTTGKVGLMFLPLCVREVRALVGVECET